MFKTAFLVGVLAVVGYVILYLAQGMGYFRHYYKHHPGQCKKINPKGVYGSEDFEVTSDGLAFITSGLFLGDAGSRLHNFVVRKGVKGKILMYNLQKPDDPVVDLKIQSTKAFDLAEFRPHGISLLEDKVKGEHLLYVVSHPIGQPDRIEKFRYLPKSKELRHEKSFLSEQIHIANDLVLLREDVFYVSDYLYFKNAALQMVEILAPLSLNRILYYDGTHFVPVVTGLNGPNGLLLSADRKFLYVNLPHQERAQVYSRDQKNGSLTLMQTVNLHTCADNLHLSQSGDALYTGAHPIALGFVHHFDDPENNIGPSQVLRMPLKNGKIQEEGITELFYDHGDLISGSSIATVYNDLLLIGSVINNLVVCDTNGPLKALT